MLDSGKILPSVGKVGVSDFKWKKFKNAHRKDGELRKLPGRFMGNKIS